jgi:protein SCO1/2
MKNKSFIGISFIVLIFGIWTVPKIISRYTDNNIVDKNRLYNYENNNNDIYFHVERDTFNSNDTLNIN